jgi:hypothetical protein
VSVSNSLLSSSCVQDESSMYSFCWKASRIGERVSEYVALGCVVMALHVLFIK